MNKNNQNIRNIELMLLLQAVKESYGYDFTEYKTNTISRRVNDFVVDQGLNYISELIPIVLHNSNIANKLVSHLTISVTSFFRDPEFFKSIQKHIIPYLSTFPFINIWCAGCATGEEAYSIAILMDEANLLNKVQIYATDINEEALNVGRKGIYPIDNLKHFSKSYDLAGGKKSMSNYFTTRYKSAIFKKKLRDKILFTKHNLASDGIFAEMHLIFCRNVLIYFNEDLQNQVTNNFYKNLQTGCFLVLGKGEILPHNTINSSYHIINNSIYKK